MAEPSNTLTALDAELILALLGRGINQHDIAALFQVNPGRVAEIATGEKFAGSRPADLNEPSVRQHLVTTAMLAAGRIHRVALMGLGTR
ncbi:hypothetical protein PQJ75_00950 [Rhodoplanes sp. TEM]|uniref:HTH luxR-type domain-containing protein n=1 Tax=Rhodoplanes tepidamans TaxID=200616 RepID=A0ABT5J5Z8_RHOTP|nr:MULTISPECIES: hypothetical protein [Rhodoplanes]MDC7784821.1 hypothetical protein [Rhodoplanes tepidamans]MDC7982288.1 hypothetical protein [Rhodoplanes sp. TEM]MDQ0356296.1 hypothetical protein [Rhodoplanes tepidamans]